MTWTFRNLPEIRDALLQHLFLSVSSVAMGLVISLALAILCARRDRLYAVVLTLTNVLFIIPSLALFALLIPFLGLGTKPVLVGLTSYSLLILLRNAVTGLRSVPPEVLEAADGMGYGRAQRLWRIELPLALPLIVSGIRIALVTVIGIATVAAFVDGGGLGTIILTGLYQNWTEKILVGGLLTALLAVVFDVLLQRGERLAVRWSRT